MDAIFKGVFDNELTQVIEVGDFLLCRTRSATESNKAERACHRNTRADVTVDHHNDNAHHSRQKCERYKKALGMLVLETVSRRHNDSKHERNAKAKQKILHTDKLYQLVIKNTLKYCIHLL